MNSGRERQGERPRWRGHLLDIFPMEASPKVFLPCRVYLVEEDDYKRLEFRHRQDFLVSVEIFGAYDDGWRSSSLVISRHRRFDDLVNV